MATYSQNDINIRLQQLSCCIGTEAKKLAQYYLYGSECVDEQLNKVTLLNAYMDMLGCYQVNHEASQNYVYAVDFRAYNSLITGGWNISFYLNGINILNYVTGSNILATELSAMETALELLTDYIISVTTTANALYIEVPCQYTDIFVLISDNKSFTDEPTQVDIYQQGYCEIGDSDNCITEKQVNTILENIAIMCKNCFKPAGFAYKPL